jgi:hypothetical protein
LVRVFGLRGHNWFDVLVDDALEWLGRRVVTGEVLERSFFLPRESTTIPGVLWLPASPAPARSLILLGHGGSGHKQSDRIVDLGRWFAGMLASRRWQSTARITAIR